MKISALLNILMELQLRVQEPCVGSAINYTILKNVGAPQLLSYVPPVYIPLSITAQLSGETRNLSKSSKSNCELYGILWASTVLPPTPMLLGDAGWMTCHSRHKLAALRLWNRFT